ncbi:MAG: superinfection immunity protein [Bacteroidales bacterium]|jgi:hypothetical protein|nr:superinfection immunity protein [Bacteroidales bacterium]
MQENIITKSGTYAVKGAISTIRIAFSILLMISIYFLPTGISLIKKRINTGAIFALNLFLGFTIIGWIIALCWATSRDSIKTQISIQKQINKGVKNDKR